MNNQELLKACLEKLELYHAAVKGEYPGGMPNQVLLPALRGAIANPAARPEARPQILPGWAQVPIEPSGVILAFIACEYMDPPLMTRDQARTVWNAILAEARTRMMHSPSPMNSGRDS